MNTYRRCSDGTQVDLGDSPPLDRLRGQQDSERSPGYLHLQQIIVHELDHCGYDTKIATLNACERITALCRRARRRPSVGAGRNGGA
jgi:hypothetical protein